jgi:hypothetical protein
MTQLTPLRPIPFYALSGENADSAPRALFAILDFATATQWEGDLLSQLQSKRFQSLRTIYFDAMDCASPVTILFPQTQQRLVIEPATWGYMPVIVSDQMQFQISGTAPDRFRLHLLNMDFEPAVGGNTTYAPPIPFSDIEMTGPALLGREAASLGPAEEIGLGTDFAIVGGNLELTGDPSGPFVAKAGGSPGGDMTGSLQIVVPGNLTTFQHAALSGAPSVFGNANALHQSDDNSTQGFNAVFYHNTPAPVLGSNIFKIVGWAKNAAGTPVRFTQFQNILDVATAGAEQGTFGIATVQAGALAFRLRIGNGTYLGVPTGTADQGAGTLNTQGGIYANSNLAITPQGLLRRRPFATLAALNAAVPAPNDGDCAIIGDALGPAYGAAVVGGGAVRIPVWWNAVAAAWIVG